jgi:hypothetical protein
MLYALKASLWGSRSSPVMAPPSSFGTSMMMALWKTSSSGLYPEIFLPYGMKWLGASTWVPVWLARVMIQELLESPLERLLWGLNSG